MEQSAAVIFNWAAVPGWTINEFPAFANTRTLGVIFRDSSLIEVFMRHVNYLLVSVAVLCSANFFFLRCGDPEEQKAENITLGATKNVVDTVLINQGKLLFKDTCGSCHAIWKTDNYLVGIVERLGTPYLKLYITRQDSLIEAKNEYALKIKKSYGNLASVHNYQFSDEQLSAIIAYLKKYPP